MSNNIQTRKATEAQLIDRAIKDPAFRAELVADPKAVFARELGIAIVLARPVFRRSRIRRVPLRRLVLPTKRV